MSFFNLLSFFDRVFTENDTQMVTIFAWILLSALILAAVLLSAGKKQMKTADIVYAGITIALSFVLSFIKISPVANGGSITFASMLPIILYSYYFGFGKGLIVGFAYGLLQFVQEPYILTPVTFALDYLLAFSSIALASLPKRFVKNQAVSLLLATVMTYLLRFIFHFISGVVYFNLGAIWAELPASDPIAYSLLYQIIYLLPDWIICVSVLLTLEKLGIVNRLAPASFRTKKG